MKSNFGTLIWNEWNVEIRTRIDQFLFPVAVQEMFRAVKFNNGTSRLLPRTGKGILTPPMLNLPVSRCRVAHSVRLIQVLPVGLFQVLLLHIRLVAPATADQCFSSDNWIRICGVYRREGPAIVHLYKIELPEFMDEK